MKTVLETGEKTEYAGLLSGRRDEWKNLSLKIAVTGNSGVGKSSFINAIRGVTADEPEAADVQVTETTMDIRSYPHPDNPMLQLLDLPGVGTDRFPRETYLSQIDVDSYDFFLLVAAHRFTENDTWLGNELRKRNKKYFFVRTKIANDISDNKKAHPQTHNEEVVIEKIRKDVTERLRKNECPDVPVFLIDNFEPSKFEFEKLKRQLIEYFSGQKRTALILSLHSTSEETIRLKVAELRSRILWSATLLAAGAAVPIPGVSVALDIGIITHEAFFFFKQLGLDDDSLQRYARLYSADYNRMKLVISSALGTGAIGTITVVEMKPIVLMILKRCVPALAASAAGKAAHIFLPLIGSLIAAPLSFAVTHTALKLILSKFEETAIKVMKCLREEEKDINTTEEATDSADTQSSGDVKEPELPSQEAETAGSKDADNNDRAPIQESLNDEAASVSSEDEQDAGGGVQVHESLRDEGSRVSSEDAQDAGTVQVKESLGDEAEKTGTGDPQGNEGIQVEQSSSEETENATRAEIDAEN